MVIDDDYCKRDDEHRKIKKALHEAITEHSSVSEKFDDNRANSDELDLARKKVEDLSKKFRETQGPSKRQ